VKHEEKKHDGHHMGKKHGGSKHHGLGKKESGFSAHLGKMKHGKSGLEGPHHK